MLDLIVGRFCYAPRVRFSDGRLVRLQLVDQCEDEELMDIVLPRLTKVLSVWELLLAKVSTQTPHSRLACAQVGSPESSRRLRLFQVERSGPARTHFPDVYREFESLQAQVRQAAQDYIVAPQGGAAPLEIRNIEVRASRRS